ncbi:S-methyl-5-thioribose-1-phosphate isomerase [Methanosphaera sp. Vir-13MRS]|uniref:S-methyl-5-thioribose-1-phosphate isomerase n=1 Tax=Candidatus Methanosphaera massiliense TaxID=3017187 RepID=UPI0023806ACB|nr:S-methyl-5-thioribose-1-phosphate isomerase [Candidatus Methanosphaera massiliense]MDE4077416.1 S-methyl-5-thioribose-1-phosphate isomerase [Candidatus Methanosphaera massiliense]
MIETLYWKDNKLYLLDQTILPHEIEYCECKTYQEVITAIKTMKVRGAPAIGVSAAYAMALAEVQGENLEQAGQEIKQARPTAINLFWAVDKVLKSVEQGNTAVDTAIQMEKEDISINKKIGEYGNTVIDDGDTILTHCNAGALACAGYGTALGVIRAANEHDKNINVICDETRPVLQGARLSVFEMQEENIPVRLIVDGAAGHMMQKGEVDKVVIGADRVAKGGVANKIGSLMVALAAKRYNIPFYVAAPISTFDFENNIFDTKIEERNPEEVLVVNGKYIAREETRVENPAFDIVESNLITGIITEEGIKKPL